MGSVQWLITGGLLLMGSIDKGLTAYPNFPANEYTYALEREELLYEEKRFQNKRFTLNEDEEVVDRFLKHLKWKEFQATKDGDFPPLRPIEEMMPIIIASELYSHLQTLPKGGNMHSHENHQVSKSTLLDIVYASDDFQYLHILPADHPTSPWTLNFFTNPPSAEWIKVEGNDDYTKDKVLPHQTFIGILSDEAKQRPTDSGLRWTEMNPLWGRGSSQLIANLPIKLKYLEAILSSSLEEGVQYIESRKSLSTSERIYVMDPAATETNGKRIIDETEGEMDITLAMEVVSNFTDNNPEFIGMKRIFYVTRVLPTDTIRDEADKIAEFYEKYPEHVLGFDMVGEEDNGNSHLFYIEPLVNLYDPATQLSKVPLYMHTAETNWAEDLITSTNDEDPVATIENAYEAILLGVKRIGHGLGFIKHPYLLELIRERQIPIETCVVSNQILGFMADLRNHPAIDYFRQGIPVMLGADDPGTFGLDFFTLDWYQAFMGWGLDLADMKQLAWNSLMFSGMSQLEKDEAIDNKWVPLWNKYIEDKKAVACATNFTTSAPKFGQIFPRVGANEGTTHVNVFGRHFEQAICAEVKCRFGDHESVSAHYVTQNHLICEAPAPDMGEVDELEVDVQVSLDGGITFHDHPRTFTYKHDLPATPSPSPPAGSATSLHAPILLASLLLFGLLL